MYFMQRSSCREIGALKFVTYQRESVTYKVIIIMCSVSMNDLINESAS